MTKPRLETQARNYPRKRVNSSVSNAGQVCSGSVSECRQAFSDSSGAVRESSMLSADLLQARASLGALRVSR